MIDNIEELRQLVIKKRECEVLIKISDKEEQEVYKDLYNQFNNSIKEILWKHKSENS